MAETQNNQDPLSQKHELPEESRGLNRGCDLSSSLKRTSSGISSLAAEDAASMAELEQENMNKRHDGEDFGFYDDSRSSSPNLPTVMEKYLPESPNPPKVVEKYLPEDVKRDLESMLNKRHGRSLSQGEIHVDSLSDQAPEMSKSDIASKTSSPKRDKEPRDRLVARGLTEKAATLPSSPKHRQGTPISAPEEKHEEITSSKTDKDKKMKHGFSKFQSIKRSLSTRMSKPKSKTKVYQRKDKAMTSRDNLSDSEYSAETKPSDFNKRLSRSLDNLDWTDGYDVVGESALKTLLNDSTEDGLYEKLAIGSKVDEPNVPLQSVGHTGGDISDRDIRTPLMPIGASVTSKPRPKPRPRTQPSLKKPVPKPRQNVQATQSSPLPPPSAKENREMAENAIRNIMNDNPDAEMTEIIIQTNHFVAKYCDENGGYLEVGSKTATLLIPPFALDKATFIYVQIEESHCFSETQEGSQIAPVVHCGTPGTQFNSPVILTLLASVENFDYLQVTGLRKESIENQQEEWKETSQNGGKVISTGSGKCVLMLNHFTGDTVAGKLKVEENRKHFAEIWFSAFTSSVLGEDMTFDIRVWISSNKQWLSETVERELHTNHARMLGHFQPTMYLFEDAGDVVLTLKNLHSQWALVSTSDDDQQATTIPIEKLLYDNQADAIKESHVFRIRPLGEFQPKEAVNFDVAMCQKDKEKFGVRLQVRIIPEMKQANVRPGQQQQYRVLRQVAKLKPNKQSLDDLKRSLSTNWNLVAAWLRLDFQEIKCFPCPVSGMISQLCIRHAGSTSDYMRESLKEIEKALDKLPLPEFQESSLIVKSILEDDACPVAVDTDVVVRQPEEASWNPPKQAIEVNEYRFYHHSPYDYHTLRSDIDHGGESDMTTRQVSYHLPVQYESNQGARPKTLRSHVQPVPSEQVWPQSDYNCNNVGATDILPVAEGMANNYSPTRMDRRPQFPVPVDDQHDYPYDEPVSPTGATGITDSNPPMMNDVDGDEYDVVAIQELQQSQNQNSSEIIRDIARGDCPEPDYVNAVIADDHQKKPPRKGYVFACKKERK